MADFRFFPESAKYTSRELKFDTFGSFNTNSAEYKAKVAQILSPKTLETVEVVLRNVEISKEKREIVRTSLEEIKQRKNELIELIKQSQTFDPTNPPKDFYRELRFAVLEKLNIPPGKEDDVKVFSALGTPLDVIGIDGFITWQKNKKEVLVTLDVSKKEKEYGAADIIFEEWPTPEENEEEYLAFIDRLANKISGKLKETRL